MVFSSNEIFVTSLIQARQSLYKSFLNFVVHVLYQTFGILIEYNTVLVYNNTITSDFCYSPF